MVCTYRGVQYNWNEPKEEYIRWYSSIHNDASRYLVYRGQAYRPAAMHLRNILDK